MNRQYYMVEENALPQGRWILGNFRSTDFEDRRRLGRQEPCKGVFTVDPGDGGRALEFSLTAFGLPIATINLAETISRIAGDDVHLVPVRIKGYGEFRFVQCLRVLDCLDESRAVFQVLGDDDPTPSMRGQYSVSKLIVDPARIPADAHMFHVARWCVRPVISSALRQVLVETGSVGVDFVEA